MKKGMRRAVAAMCVCVAAFFFSPAARAELFSKTPQEAAAKKTARINASCERLGDFYWEIGDADSILAKGQSGYNPPRADTPLPVDTASAWLVSAYFLEKAAKENMPLDEDAIDALTMRSAYTTPLSQSCKAAATVKSCFGNLGGYRKESEEAADRGFYFGPGHLQKLGMDMGIGGLFDAALRDDMIEAFDRRYYKQSFETLRLMDGIVISPYGYGRFLRETIAGKTRMSAMLGRHAACAWQGEGCPGAVYSPAPEKWDFSLGHWVETDDARGHGAFSAFSRYGFYAWITPDKKHYGIVAAGRRKSNLQDHAIFCGRALRAAYETGRTQCPCNTAMGR